MEIKKQKKIILDADKTVNPLLVKNMLESVTIKALQVEK
jgi:hypothetical protein